MREHRLQTATYSVHTRQYSDDVELDRLGSTSFGSADSVVHHSAVQTLYYRALVIEPLPHSTMQASSTTDAVDSAAL